MAFLPDLTDPYAEDLALQGTRQSLEDPAWESVKSLLRPAEKAIESTGNVRDIVGGAALEGDPLAFFKLAPGAMQKSAWDDVKGALGFGPSTFEKSTTTGKELINKIAGQPSPEEGYLGAVGRPVGTFLADMALDPATGLMWGAAAPGKTLAEMGTAQGLLDLGAELPAQYGPEAMAAFAEAKPGLETAASQAELFHKISHPLFTAGTLPGAVEGARGAYQSYQEQGFTPQTAGRVAEAVGGAIPLLGAPGDLLNHAEALYDKYTNPNYVPRNPHAAVLARGLDILQRKGIITPEVLKQTIAGSEKLYGEPTPEDEVTELTKRAEPSSPSGPQGFGPPGTSGEEPPLNTDEMLAELEWQAQQHNNPPSPTERAKQERQARNQPEYPPAPLTGNAKAIDEVFSGAENERMLKDLGWTKDEIDAFDPEDKSVLAEQGIGPRDVEDYAQQMRPSPKELSKFPMRPKKPTTEVPISAKVDLTTVPTTDMRGSYTDMEIPEKVQEFVDENGIEVYPDANGKLPNLGSGAFHTTYALGKATKGPLAGKEVVLRVGNERRSGGPVFKGMDEFLEHGGTKTTETGSVLDLVERTHSHKELGIPEAVAFQHRYALSKSLRSKLPPKVRIRDLVMNEGNARYVRDENGSVKVGGVRYRPVVSDFGVANPTSNIARAEPGEARPLQARVKPIDIKERPGKFALDNPDKFGYRAFQELIDKQLKIRDEIIKRGGPNADTKDINQDIIKAREILAQKKNGPAGPGLDAAIKEQEAEMVEAPQRQLTQAAVDLAKRKLKVKGWSDIDLAKMTPGEAVVLSESWINKREYDENAKEFGGIVPQKGRFPQEPARTTDKLSPSTTAQLSRNLETGGFNAPIDDAAVPAKVQKLIDTNGIKLYSDTELPLLGNGAFHATYALGKATKGKLAGKEVVLRVGNVKGKIFKNLREMVGHAGTLTTPNGTVLDLTERTYGKEELGVSEGRAFRHRVQLAASLRGKIPSQVTIQDLINNRGNARYIPDPNGPVEALGKKWRPVVSDFGVINPENNISRAEPGGETAIADMASPLAHEQANNPTSPEHATEMADSVVKAPEPPKPVVSPGWHEAHEAIDGPLRAAKAKGLSDITDARNEFMDKGVTSFLGRTLDADSVPEQLSYLQAMMQAPFEIGSIYGFKKGKDGKTTVAFHRAYTSGRAKSFNAAHPIYQEGLKAAEEAVKRGEIDGYYTAHNHAGDVADASSFDMAAIAEYAAKAGKGYHGEIITDGDTWTHVPAKKSIAKYEEGLPIPADKLKFRAQKFEVPPVEGVDQPQLTPILRPARDGRLGFERTYNPKELAEHIKGALTAGRGTIFSGLGGDGTIKHIMAMPAEEFANMTPSEADKFFTAAAARHGVMAWHITSNLDPNSALKAKISTLATELKQNKLFKSPVAGHMNSWNGDITHQTSLDIVNNEFPRKTLRLLSEATDLNAKYEAQEQANNFILKKLLEFGEKAKERKGTEDATLQGELAQHEIGPPDHTLKPGQGGKIGLNVERNLEGESDQTVRTEIAQALKLNEKLDRAKPQPTAEEIQDNHQELLSHMSADELHDTMKFMSTEKGMQVLHERANFYHEAKTQAQDARATYQQMVEAGKGVEDPAALDKAKADWVEKDFIKQTAMRDFVNAKTTVGRLLSFLKDLKKQELDPTQTRLGAMMSALKQKGVKGPVLEALRDIYENNPADFAGAVEKALKPSLFRAFLQIWKAGLISGPPTRMANTGSNAMWRGMLDLSRNTISPALDAVKSKLTGAERERYFGEAQASAQAYIQQFPLAMKRWMADKGGFTTKDIHTFAETKQDFRGEGAAQHYFGKPADIMDMFFKGLNVDDTVAKHMAAAQAVYRLAYRTARKGGKTHAEAMKEYVPLAQEIMAGLRDPGGPAYAKHAAFIEGDLMKAVKSETFQAELGQFGKSTEAFLKKHPSLQLIIPFYNTPINILKETLKATPYGAFMEGGFLREGGGGKKAIEALVNKEGWKAALSKINGHDIDELSKMLMGSAITGLVGTLAQYGSITGGGPNDPRKEAELRKTGWQPYSVKIGDTYYNYQRMEPIAGVMGIAADIFDAVKSGELNLHDEKGRKAIKQLMATVFKNMENKTFLAGFEGFVSAATDPERNFDRWARQMEGSLVPNIVGKTAQAFDPQFRDTSKGWTAPIQAKIPGLSNLLEGQETASGQPRMRVGGPLQRFFSPLTASKEENTPEAGLSKELVRVNYLPSIPKSFKTIGGKQIALLPAEIEMLKDAKDQASKVAKAAIKDPSYLNLPDSEEDPKYRLGMNTKQDVLKRIYQRYRRPVQDKINVRVRQRALKEMA